MPRMPENGARIVLRSMVARISPTRASVCLLFGHRPVVFRLRDRRARSAGPASARSSGEPGRAALRRAASCARSCRVSSCARTSPLADRLAGIERDAIDDAGQIGADGDALDRGHRADRASVAGQSSCCATMVVTASGGGWKDAPCAMAVWIWRNFTKPRAADEQRPSPPASGSSVLP